MKIASGSLDRQILIEQSTTSRSRVAQQIDAWDVLATIRAQRLDLRMGQQAELKPGGDDKAPGRALVATARYKARYRADLAIGMRATVDGGVYSITAIEEEDRGRTMILTLSA